MRAVKHLCVYARSPLMLFALQLIRCLSVRLGLVLSYQ